jgi:excisionase family DNA binding protein
MQNEKFITTEKLSSRLGLPRDYILELAQRKEIPSLNVRGRYRFNPEAVQSALDKLAEQGVTNAH